MGDGDSQVADTAPKPSGQVPNEYEAAKKDAASQDDLDAATRVIKEVQTTNRLILVVLFASFIAIELALIIFASATLISDISSRNDLKVQVQVLTDQVKVLDSKLH